MKLIFLHLIALIASISCNSRASRLVTLQQIQNRCLTHQNTAPKDKSCTTQNGVKMQMANVEDGIFFCISYKKSPGDAYNAYDIIRIILHPDYDLQYSGANAIDYEQPTFKVYHSSDYHARFAIFSNNSEFRIYVVTINEVPQSCNFGKRGNRLWPHGNKTQVSEPENEGNGNGGNDQIEPNQFQAPTLPTTTEKIQTTTVDKREAAIDKQEPEEKPELASEDDQELPPIEKQKPAAVDDQEPIEKPKTAIDEKQKSVKTDRPSDKQDPTPVEIEKMKPMSVDNREPNVDKQEPPINKNEPVDRREPTTSTITPNSTPQSIDENPSCGMVQKIVDLSHFSMPTNPGQFPFVASIHQVIDGDEKNSIFKCSGSIIDQSVIITSVNCLMDSNARLLSEDEIQVHVGQYSKNAKNPPSKIYEVSQIIPHEQFNLKLDNNVAVLKLKHKIEFGDFVQPACLPDKNTSIAEGSNGKLAGFEESSGLLTEADFMVSLGDEQDDLSEDESEQVEPKNPAKCMTLNGNNTSNNINSSSLGGGLFMSNPSSPNQFIIIGIVSRLPPASSNDCNAVFTNMLFCLEWVHSCLATLEKNEEKSMS